MFWLQCAQLPSSIQLQLWTPVCSIVGWGSGSWCHETCCATRKYTLLVIPEGSLALCCDTGCGSTFVWLQRWTPVYLLAVTPGRLALSGGHCFGAGHGPVGPLGTTLSATTCILSSKGCLPGVGEKLSVSVVWRLGSGLLEIPQLPPCVGVAPHGLELGVLNHSLGFFSRLA